MRERKSDSWPEGMHFKSALLVNVFFILLSVLQGDFKSRTSQGTDQCLHVRELLESRLGSFQRVAGKCALSSLRAGNSDYSHKLD